MYIGAVFPFCESTVRDLRELPLPRLRLRRQRIFPTDTRLLNPSLCRGQKYQKKHSDCLLPLALLTSRDWPLESTVFPDFRYIGSNDMSSPSYCRDQFGPEGEEQVGKGSIELRRVCSAETEGGKFGMAPSSQSS